VLISEVDFYDIDRIDESDESSLSALGVVSWTSSDLTKLLQLTYKNKIEYLFLETVCCYLIPCRMECCKMEMEERKYLLLIRFFFLNVFC